MVEYDFDEYDDSSYVGRVEKMRKPKQSRKDSRYYVEKKKQIQVETGLKAFNRQVQINSEVNDLGSRLD